MIRNIFLMGSLSLRIGNDMIDSRLIGDELMRKVAFTVSVLKLFRTFDFVPVTVEKPDSQR